MDPVTTILFKRYLWRPLKAILTIGFPVQLWMVLALVALHFISQGSAIRDAVSKAVVDLVAAGRIAALEAEGEALQKIADERKRQLEEAANKIAGYQDSIRIFEIKSSEDKQTNQALKEEIDELLSAEPGSRVASDDFVYRMRKLERGN